MGALAQSPVKKFRLNRRFCLSSYLWNGTPRIAFETISMETCMFGNFSSILEKEKPDEHEASEMGLYVRCLDIT
jgi:hypothetical protein